MRPPSEALVLFGIDHDRNSWSVLFFDSEMHKGERIADMEQRTFASYSVVEENIFVVGGSTAQQTYSTCVEEFSVRERRWLRRAPLTVGRKWHAAAVVRAGDAGQTLLGVFGGNHGDACENQISSCEVYN
ncbi:unnamed protein product, partial [Dibothriocephalus latus]